MCTRPAGVLATFLLSALAAGAAQAAPAAGTPARAQKTAPPAGEPRRLVEEILATYRPYACCADRLAACLAKQPVCPLATRLERAIRRMAGAGLAKPAIEAALAQRQATMKPEQTRATIVLDGRFRAGNAKAPVALAVYACPRQEACAKLVPDLYREVTDGRLKDKAVLHYRPFFPPGNEEALECGRGLYAAAYQGKFWPYLLHLCLEREHLQRPTLRDWAGQHGLDRCIFDHTCEQPDTAAWLEASRKEGLGNGVTAAPAAFLNGRRVQGPLDLETLVDLAEEEHERLAQAPTKEGATSKPPVRKPAHK
jgi:protein-disulfide isomerase